MNNLPLISAGLAVCALAISLLALIKMFSLNKLRQTFFSGKEAANLEQFIINQSKKVNDLSTQVNLLEKELKATKNQQKLAIQKMGVVRYNPFEDNGGNLSFSIAILDAGDSGVVITSMHGREQNRIYAKPIQKGKSEFSLTAEEVQAISSSKLFKE